MDAGCKRQGVKLNFELKGILGWLCMHNIQTSSVRVCCLLRPARIEAELERRRLTEREELMQEVQEEMDLQRQDYEARLKELSTQMVCRWGGGGDGG